MGTYASMEGELSIPLEFEHDVFESLVLAGVVETENYWTHEQYPDLSEVFRANSPAEEFSWVRERPDVHIVRLSGFGKLHSSFDALLETLAGVGVTGRIDMEVEGEHWRDRLVDGEVVTHAGQITYPTDTEEAGP